MRIISGKHKGRKLVAPKKLPVRPTTDMAKEALFNILANQYYLDDLTVLDLFSGTGNISFEFASRGVKNSTVVDSNSACIQYITKISNELDLGIRCVKSDVCKFLETSKTSSDIIFADPPYSFSFEQIAKITSLVFKNNLLRANGTLIIEHSDQTDLSELPNFSESRKYGSSKFSFFNISSDVD